ncbi:MAG: hypothetical protein H7039_03740 [Bryobacteraceae bacterium]|nr:hypothetical protein [Bryobacteraceae bacterium]
MCFLYDNAGLTPGLFGFMGFLDNLESSLKSLEGNQERDNGVEENQRRQDERSRALAVAPSAEALRKSDFTNSLLLHAVQIAHGLRVKVNMVWVANTLRLDARNLRLELSPTANGVEVAFWEAGQVRNTEPVDLNGDAKALAVRWLEPLTSHIEAEED